MTLLLLLLIILLLIYKKTNIAWIFNIVIMWISPVVSVLGVSFIGSFQKFCSVFIFFVCEKRCVSWIDREFFKIYLILLCLYSPIILFSAGNLINNIIVFGSTIFLWLFSIGVWKLKVDKKVISKTMPIVLFFLVAMCIYGIISYITTTDYYYKIWGDNLLMNNNYHMEEIIESAFQNQRMGLKGRITGTAQFAIQYAILTIIEVYYVLGLFRNKIKRIYLLFILFLLIVNIVFTGSRGPLVALIVSLFVYYLRRIGFKYYVILLFVFLFLVLAGNFDYVIRLYASEDISGSSYNGRIMQFAGAMNIISKDIQSLLWGKGLYWVSDYLRNYGAHPICLAFESEILSRIVNTGLYGLLVLFPGEFVLFYLLIRKFSKKNIIDKDSYYLLSSMLLMKLIYNISVGEGYTYLYYLTFLMTLKMSIQNKKNEIYICKK